MTYTYRDANGVEHTREIFPALVSLRKPESLIEELCRVTGKGSEMGQVRLTVAYPSSHPLGKINARVELLGNASFGKIVRPEFAGAKIADGTLRPLTVFYR